MHPKSQIKVVPPASLKSSSLAKKTEDSASLTMYYVLLTKYYGSGLEVPPEQYICHSKFEINPGGTCEKRYNSKMRIFTVNTVSPHTLFDTVQGVLFLPLPP